MLLGENKMKLYNPKNGEKLESYNVFYMERKTGEVEKSDTIVHMYAGEVIERQIKQSTFKTVVLFKKVGES